MIPRSRTIVSVFLLLFILHPGGRYAIRDFASLFTKEVWVAHIGLILLVLLWIRRARPGYGMAPSDTAPQAFVLTRRSLPDTEILEAARRSAMRAAGVVRLDLRRGLPVLASIASTAFLLGCFGTCLGIVSSFRGFDADRWTIFSALVASLAESLVPVVLSLVVAIPAWCFYQYCTAQIGVFEAEMENSALELMNRSLRSRLCKVCTILADPRTPVSGLQ